MNEPLKIIIDSQLTDRESLQPEVESVLGVVIEKIIEAGTVLADSGEYRFGSGTVNADSAVKRMINSITPVLRSEGGYRVGLIDTNEQSLCKQHELLSSQITQLTKQHLEGETARRLASDIADVILTSWFLVRCLPNESGWGRKWAAKCEREQIS